MGDFVILRKDGLFAYQLAVVVDDAFQGVTHVIRGYDLLDSTARQIYLQRLLGFSTPRYGHIPVIVNSQGEKLSKQRFADPVGTANPPHLLLLALRYLHQDPDPALEEAGCEEILQWAIRHWEPSRLAGIRTLSEL